MHWKLYYHDHQPGAIPLVLDGGLKVSTFASKDGPWIDAPPLGVMGLATWPDRTVGHTRDTGDFYVWGRWAKLPWACDQWGLMDVLIKAGRMTANDLLPHFSITQLAAAGVKFGRSLDNADWQTVLTWMTADPDLPRKSARYRHERPEP